MDYLHEQAFWLSYLYFLSSVDSQGMLSLVQKNYLLAVKRAFLPSLHQAFLAYSFLNSVFPIRDSQATVFCILFIKALVGGKMLTIKS